MMGMDLTVAEHKGVVISLGEGDDWVSIYSCISIEEGRGNTQEAIAIIKNDYKGKELCGSVPLNDAMKHIYDKLGVNYIV